MSSLLVKNTFIVSLVRPRISRDLQTTGCEKTPFLRQKQRALGRGIHTLATLNNNNNNKETMSGQGDGAYSDRWENMWKAGIQPGQAFDAECCSPSLQELLSSQLGDLEGKKVFIPGCGRGYDVVAFAKAGAKEVVGLELAPTAVRMSKIVFY